VEITTSTIIKVATEFLLTIALVSAPPACYFPLLVKIHGTDDEMLKTILMFVLAPMATLEMLAIIIPWPIKNIGKAVKQRAKGNFDSKVYSGKINSTYPRFGPLPHLSPYKFV
jgi:hypothetical protein